MVGRQWVIQMAPMASITAVTWEPGPSRSNLVVTTTAGTADFRIEPETAEQARTLLARLIADSANQPDGAIDLINMKWKVGTDVIDPLDFDEEPARLLGL